MLLRAKSVLFVSGVCAAAAAAVALAGCGGGGGGATADVTGKVMLIGVGSPIVPNPPATVQIAGASTQTLADGTFALRGVSASSTQIVVKATGALDLTQPLSGLVPSQTNDLGTIYLSNTGYTSSVTATVLRSDTRAAVGGARVMMNGQTTTTATNGTFSFAGLPEGLGGPGIEIGRIFSPDPTTLEDKPIVIDLPLGPGANNLGDILMSPPVGGIPGGPYNIKGVISLQGQADLSGSVVTLLSGGTVVGTYNTVVGGAYGFWVAAGTYTVKAEHPGFTAKTQDVTLTSPDKTVTVNMTLTP